MLLLEQCYATCPMAQQLLLKAQSSSNAGVGEAVIPSRQAKGRPPVRLAS